MQDLAQSVYLRDVLFGKKDSQERFEITSFIEMTDRMGVEEFVGYINTHLEMKMFLIGQSISAADIVVHLKMAAHVRDLKDYQKIEIAHAFRWIDHI